MADYSKRLLKKEFEDKTSKAAFLKACKYLSENIVNNQAIAEHCSYTIVPAQYDKSEGIHKCVLEVYSKVSEDEILAKHCAICKETHSSFFINEETNCNWCKISALHRRIDQQVAVKQRYIKDKFYEV